MKGSGHVCVLLLLVVNTQHRQMSDCSFVIGHGNGEQFPVSDMLVYSPPPHTSATRKSPTSGMCSAYAFFPVCLCLHDY